MKVLFLDIDGVLNHVSTRERCGDFVGVDKALAKRLGDWLKAHPEVKIVLSSTWRKFPDMHPHLHENGIEWIDVTPAYHYKERGDEIRAWLDKHPEVTEFAILDDTADMSAVNSNFVQTNHKVGLTDEDLVRIEKILNVHASEVAV